jgi:hypothetical protein
VNDDGFADIIIGAPTAVRSGLLYLGEAYVVFGGDDAGAGGSIDLASLDGANGFAMTGLHYFDLLGYSVSTAGDLNDDGVDDLIVGGIANDSYVVFGAASVGAGGRVDLSALDGTDGFVLNGIGPSDSAGLAVSGAGDVNDDGVDDLLVGAPGLANEAYVFSAAPASEPAARSRCRRWTERMVSCSTASIPATLPAKRSAGPETRTGTESPT